MKASQNPAPASVTRVVPDDAAVADARHDAVGEVHGRPLTLSIEGLAQLAPLQRLTVHEKLNISQFLTFTEATWLTLTSKDLNAAIRLHPRSKLNDISHKLQSLGFNQLIQDLHTVDAEINRLGLICQPNGGTVTGALPLASPSQSQSFTIRGHRFNLPRTPREKKRAEAREQACELKREREADRTTLVARLEALEPFTEALVFHVAAEHRIERRPVEIARGNLGKMYQALEDGDVELVRLALRELLSLPSGLMSNARKVAWLRAPQGVDMLKTMGRRCCGDLEKLERDHYDAISAYVEEIVSSHHLSDAEKIHICTTLSAARTDQRAESPAQERSSLVRHAYESSNPAFAAALLLGIYRSGAKPTLKRQMFCAAAEPWNAGVATCTQEVRNALSRYQQYAPEWVGGAIQGLNEMRLAFA